jgi:Sulfatase
MPPLLSSIALRLTATDTSGQPSNRRLAPLIACHVAAVAIMLWSEVDAVSIVAFVLAWALMNFFWLAVCGRPVVSAALSLILLIVLVALSRFKFHVLGMTATFIDVMIIDSSTVAFLAMVFPSLRTMAALVLLAALPAMALLWWFDSLRMWRRTAAFGVAASLLGLVGLALAVPVAPGAAFGNENYLSTFARSAIESVFAYASQGLLEADPAVVGRLDDPSAEACEPVGKPPHIILVHDESSFDIRDIPDIKVPPGYGGHFASFDGRRRKLLVEGAGGPSWFTEYNVLAGLSSRSYGRFQFFVTQIAAGRVLRGLPRSLAHCGYRTFSLFPVHGGFLGAAAFHKGTGIETFIDGRDVGAGTFEPDRFYYGNAASTIAREHAKGPMFVYVYLTANHFTWDFRRHEELTPPGWQNPGNEIDDVDEYLRRQAMSEIDYKNFVAQLARDYPGEPFMIVRYGDHQPDFAKDLIDPSLDNYALGNLILGYDPRLYTTYYAIDTINYCPVDLGSARDVLDAPYLPLVVQEAAGIPLDPSFAEQKKILDRCAGLFYGCAAGAEARRFNRLLIDAGLIKGL